MRQAPRDAVWIGGAFAAAVGAAALVLALLGADKRGSSAALAATARIAFLFFWPAYAGSALALLFGRVGYPIKARGRVLGLAFAAAMLVHSFLIAWLCAIGHAPAAGVFLIFSPALLMTYALALASFGTWQSGLNHRIWKIMRLVGMNYIAFVFAYDFLRNPLGGGVKHIVEYLPFAVLAVAGPGLRLVAGVKDKVKAGGMKPFPQTPSLT